ncbi:hypothetical protein Tco_1498406 [Tanacetum coccineum]
MLPFRCVVMIFGGVTPKVVSQPKVWSDAPIIKEYESDSDDDCVSTPLKEHEKSSFAFVNMAKHVKTPRETVQEHNTCSQTVLTRTSRIPVNTARASSTNNVNTARQNSNSQAVLTSTARKVNTVRPKVNDIRPKIVFHKVHSPITRLFNRTTTPKAKFLNQKVNTTGDKAVSAVGSIRKTANNPQRALKNKGSVDSGCSRHMTGNKAYLVDYQDYNGGLVAFRGSKGHITGKGKIKTGKLDFEDVCFVKEL